MAYAVITGASGGIGRCLSRELASRKFDVLLIARSGDKLAAECQMLQHQYGIKASYLALDLSEKTSADRIVQWIDQHQAEVNVLVNNAGYGLWGEVEKTDFAQLDNMIALNINTLASLCYRMIPYLRKKTPAYILNVASTAAYQAVPTMTTYAATKAFVVLFSRGLRWELKRSGISVSCLSPGATSTGFIDRAGMEVLKERAEKFSMKPEAVAKIAIRGLFNGKAEIIPGFVNWISVKSTYILPKYLVEKIAAGLYKI
jgi:short-subunit dehydrogenase